MAREYRTGQNSRSARPSHAGSEQHLLTVLHAAEATGPPLFALRFLRWLSEHDSHWKMSTLFWDSGGGLESDFEQLGPVLVAGPNAPYGRTLRAAHRLFVAQRLRSIRRRLESIGPFDVAHVHCAGMMRAYEALPDVPVLCHLHELEVGLDLHLGPLASEYLGSADHYVAVSDAARGAFLSHVPVDPASVERQWGFTDPAQGSPKADRSSLGLSDQAFVVIGSGLRHWRKAPELFVRTAVAAEQQAPEVSWKFVWVGGSDGGPVAELVRAAGYDSLVRFVPHQSNPSEWFAAADAFFHPAREDAFPLVCVEAAASGLPIVTFDNGGAAELVEHGRCGRVVPFPSVKSAASALAHLALNPGSAAMLGTRAREFAQGHLLLDQAGPELLAVLESTRDART